MAAGWDDDQFVVVAESVHDRDTDSLHGGQGIGGAEVVGVEFVAVRSGRAGNVPVVGFVAKTVTGVKTAAGAVDDEVHRAVRKAPSHRQRLRAITGDSRLRNAHPSSVASARVGIGLPIQVHRQSLQSNR